MLARLKEYDKIKLAFNFILFIWVISIPFKNAVYQISTILIILFFISHLLISKNFAITARNFNQMTLLSVFVFLIIFSMVIANLLNLELLGKKSWHHITMFVLRYIVVFIALAYFYALGFFEKKNLLYWLLFGTMILALSGIISGILNPNILFNNPASNDIGLKGTLNNRNAMGLMMSASVVFSLFLFRKNFILALILIAIYGFCMIFSFSRSGWVASAVAVGIFLLLNFKKLDKKIFIAFGIFVLILITLFLCVDSFHFRLNQLLQGYSSYRAELWKYGLSMISQNPLFGYGVGVWKVLPKNEYIAIHTGVHNSTIEILLFTGIFGLCAWILAVLKVGFDIFKSKNFIYFSLLAYFVIITQFDFSVFDSKELFSYITIFLFFVYSENFKNRSKI